jgi:hypothetical protein
MNQRQNGSTLEEKNGSCTGETLVVKSADGNVTVVFTDDTKTKDDKGLFGLEKQYMSNAVLIPGLAEYREPLH